MTARLVRDSPSIRVKSLRIDSSASCSRIRVPVGPPARPVAITGRPSSFSARATLTPLPPATVRASTARWRWPRRKFGTATVRSIAALSVTVRITRLPLAPPDASRARLPSRGSSWPPHRDVADGERRSPARASASTASRGAAAGSAASSRSPRSAASATARGDERHPRHRRAVDGDRRRAEPLALGRSGPRPRRRALSVDLDVAGRARTATATGSVGDQRQRLVLVRRPALGEPLAALDDGRRSCRARTRSRAARGVSASRAASLGAPSTAEISVDPFALAEPTST